MLNALSYCFVGPQHQLGSKPEERGIHKAALAADIISGLALIIVGALATQYGFLSTELQYSLIGVGSGYVFLIFSYQLIRFKMNIAPNFFLIPPLILKS
jgi:uncharacterized membrane protein YwaF